MFERFKRPSREEILASELDLYHRINRIDVFEGSLEEYQVRTGQNYYFLEPDGLKTLIGHPTKLYWRELGREISKERARTIRLGPLTLRLRHGKVYYSELLAQAAGLGADAVVNYHPSHELPNYPYETGQPVRRSEGQRKNPFTGSPWRCLYRSLPQLISSCS